MAAPGIAQFGDGSHAPGASGITVGGGGFGAFPGHIWIYQNADRTGSADELTITAWNGVQATVNIPGSLTNAAGTRYLFLQRADLAWSNAFAFTLESGVLTLTPVDIAQAEVLDGVGLTQTHLLAVNDIAQAEVLDSVGLAQTHVLTVGDIAQLQVLDSVLIIVEGVVVPIDIAQLEILGAVLLSQSHQLAVADIAQAEVLDPPAMVVTHLLTPADIAHLEALDAVGLGQAHLLSVLDIEQLQVLDPAGGGQIGFLRASSVRVFTRMRADALLVRPALSGKVTVTPQ